MHRHGYKGRKLHRERDQREALLQGLVDSLIIYESIETTHAKAKELVPYTEKLITKAKKGDLHSRRLIIASTQTKQAAHKLVDEIAPRLTGRSSGHLRISRTRLRRGDNAQLSRVSFVDDVKPQEATDEAKETERIKKPAKATQSTKPKAAKPTKGTKAKEAIK